MLQGLFFILMLTILVCTLGAQVPLAPTSQRSQDEQHTAAIFGDANPTEWEWSLNTLPNPNDTDHLVFETVHSFLQHWPNTRMRNGHNIVPGIIPKGTLLYHGRPIKQLPFGPDWLAVDPEHSYLFVRDLFNSSVSGGWQLTVMATRPLKILYFDGSSSAKLPYGSMDTQDLISWGKPSTSKWMRQEELKRIRDLCEWGKNFGVDGFVRMEMDFEIMYCDFTSGVSVSFDHLPSQWANPSDCFSSLELFEVMSSGAWHNRFPGDTRIQLDLPNMISFYDTALAPSLIPVRHGQERWDHRAINISHEDLSAVKSALEANLIRPDAVSSGIDWQTLIQVIVDRYAQRLELAQHLLHASTTSPDQLLDLAKKAQTQLRIMLTPHILLSAKPTDSSGKPGVDWAIPVYKHCAIMHTRSMEVQFSSMTDAERLLLRAVRGTTREICRIVTGIWASGVHAGIDPSLNTKTSVSIAEVAQLRERWAEELDSLMAWLDWSVWVTCKPGCSAEEICYLPTWPVGFPSVIVEQPPINFPIDDEDDSMSHADMSTLALRAMVIGKLADEMRSAIKPEPDDWIRPQPKCIRRVKPYTY